MSTASKMRTAYDLPFRPEFVFSGIGAGAVLFCRRLLTIVSLKPASSSDRHRERWSTSIPAAPGRERFGRGRTAEASPRDADHQRMGLAVSTSQQAGCRNPLDPERIIPYDCEPVIRFANGEVGMRARLDPSSARRPTGTAFAWEDRRTLRPSLCC